MNIFDHSVNNNSQFEPFAFKTSDLCLFNGKSKGINYKYEYILYTLQCIARSRYLVDGLTQLYSTTYHSVVAIVYQRYI
jgi:hypothetical protein